MQSVTNDTFGPLVAYLVPGATVLAGWSPHVPAMAGWVVTPPGEPPTIGGLVFLSVAAVVVGMTVSAVRWAMVDRVHARTGLVAPKLNFTHLPGRVAEFQQLIEIHYRYYQFYANMLVAVALAYLGHRLNVGLARPGLADLGVVLVEPVFFLTSRATLGKY